MKSARESGFSILELLGVLAIIAIAALIGWQVMEGWRERNALRMVSQDIKHTLEKYRQKAIDKGYNYGLIFSDDGIYVFEDNGGSGSNRFQAMNNFAVDAGEFSDYVSPESGGSGRGDRRVTRSTDEFRLLNGGEDPAGHLLAMSMSTLNLSSTRSGYAYYADGTDLTSSMVQQFGNSPASPFEGGSLALFFGTDGRVYLKDPTVPISPSTREQYVLGSGPQAFVVVRVAYDVEDTYRSEVPYYYEVAINRYGAATYVRWQTYDGGASWNAEVQ
jgi:Tfp pilus assembly protein FimT